MMVQVHTDNHIVGRAEVLEQVEAAIRASLVGFEDQLTRLDVYLSDDNGPKHTGDDIRCVIETHPHGGGRLAVTRHAGDMMAAVDAACEVLHRQLAEHSDRLHNGKGRTPMGGVPFGRGNNGSDKPNHTPDENS